MAAAAVEGADPTAGEVEAEEVEAAGLAVEDAAAAEEPMMEAEAPFPHVVAAVDHEALRALP